MGLIDRTDDAGTRVAGWTAGGRTRGWLVAGRVGARVGPESSAAPDDVTPTSAARICVTAVDMGDQSAMRSATAAAALTTLATR